MCRTVTGQLSLWDLGTKRQSWVEMCHDSIVAVDCWTNGKIIRYICNDIWEITYIIAMIDMKLCQLPDMWHWWKYNNDLWFLFVVELASATVMQIVIYGFVYLYSICDSKTHSRSIIVCEQTHRSSIMLMSYNLFPYVLLHAKWMPLLYMFGFDCILVSTVINWTSVV